MRRLFWGDPDVKHAHDACLDLSPSKAHGLVCAAPRLIGLGASGGDFDDLTFRPTPKTLHNTKERPAERRETVLDA